MKTGIFVCGSLIACLLIVAVCAVISMGKSPKPQTVDFDRDRALEEVRRGLIELQVAAEPVRQQPDWWFIIRPEVPGRFEELRVSAKLHQERFTPAQSAALFHFYEGWGAFAGEYNRTLHSTSRAEWDHLRETKAQADELLATCIREFAAPRLAAGAQ